MKRAMIGLSTIALLLVGCTATPPAPSPEPTSDPELGQISSIDELVDAVDAAGIECDWQQRDQVANASASGDCSTDTVLMMFDTREARENTIATLQSFAQDDSVSLLAGENWLVNSPDVLYLQGLIGGDLITAGR